MLREFLLTIAVCTDAFLAALSYGAGKIKIPILSALIISGTGAAVLTFSIYISKLIGGFIPDAFCAYASFIMLFAIGIISIFQNGLKAMLRKLKGDKKLFAFKCFDISFAIEIFLDETKADADSSKILSPKEAFALAAALSADSLASGFGAGLGNINGIRTCIISLIFGFAAISTGSLLGEYFGRKKDLSWLSGVFLIILALTKLI